MQEILAEAKAEFEQKKAVRVARRKLMRKQIKLLELIEERKKMNEKLTKNEEEIEGKYYFNANFA